MIGIPFNDYTCLSAITQVVMELVQHDDPAIVEIAKQHATTDSLATWIRSLPQKNDDGDPSDGPKVITCKPTQRLLVPSAEPNCVERAALYLAVAEKIDPKPVRQLATLDTVAGMHTFPVENGAPVILDPEVPRNGLADAWEGARDEPIVIDARDAIAWTIHLAESAAPDYRNGPSQVAQGRAAMSALVEEGRAVPTQDVDAIGWLLALAERVARRYGARALTIVRTTAQAISDLADEALARAQRNLAIEIGGSRWTAPTWAAPAARAALHVTEDLAGVALREHLGSIGLPPSIVDLVEHELEREGLTIGRLARPLAIDRAA